MKNLSQVLKWFLLSTLFNEIQIYKNKAKSREIWINKNNDNKIKFDNILFILLNKTCDYIVKHQ